VLFFTETDAFPTQFSGWLLISLELWCMATGKWESLTEIVSIDAAIMHGTPCFSGTRVPVQALLDFIEAGDTLDKFLQAFPRVKRRQAVQFLEMAKDRLLSECVSS
jgi:uncharacterized protein (DUF433 family)